MQGAENISFEHLSSEAADALMQQIEKLVDGSISSASAYDHACAAGYDQGHSSGYNEGHDQGYQKALSAFWSYDREEYRIDDYNLGYEAGKRAAEEQGGERWNEGYTYGRNAAKDEVGANIASLEAEVLKLSRRTRHWRERALKAEASSVNPASDASILRQDGNRRYSALKRSLAKLLHPDCNSASAFEQSVRQDLFKKIWSEIERIEKLPSGS